MKIELKELYPSDKEQFIIDNQWEFLYGATREFGLRDEHFEEDGQIISRKTIEESLDKGTAYRIYVEEKIAGGAVVQINNNHGNLDLLFINSDLHSKGIGYKAWCIIEKMYPNVKLWKTVTPYFEKRNIHFYVNRCGFHIVEYFHAKHKDPLYAPNDDDFEGMFLFEKKID